MEYAPDFLLGLYRTMLRIRAVEEAFVEPIINGEIKCPVHLYSGQEAVATGVCAALDRGDYVFGTHRSHGHYLAKGGGMRQMAAEIFCRESGCARGRGGSMHLVAPEVGMVGAAPIVSGTIALAVGAALASRIREENRVSVTFFGDGATGEGVLFESMNLAALRKLPVLFVCENNFYATHMPILECRPSAEIYTIALPFGIWSRRVDGNDVLEVYEAARVAVERCRRREGPAFLECVTYRLRGHVGPDDNIQGSHTDIRPRAEVEAWRKRDPLLRLEKAMQETYGIPTEALEQICLAVNDEVDDAFRFARESLFPRPGELYNYVLA